MKAAEVTEKSLGHILSNAGCLGGFLIEETGPDSIFHDKEILTGSGNLSGLYKYLQIKSGKNDIIADLHEHIISAELLLISLFDTIKPYAEMMAGLYAFFEKHYVSETGKPMSIVFEFSEIKKKKLEFHSEDFRTILEKLKNVRTLVNYFSLPREQMWNLIDSISDNRSAKTYNNDITKWIEDYQTGQLMSPLNILPPDTGNEQVNVQLKRILNIWNSFLNACLSIELSTNNAPDYLDGAGQGSDDASGNWVGGWNKSVLVYATVDRWAVVFIQCLFSRLEEIASFTDLKRRTAYRNLGLNIQRFLDKVTVSEVAGKKMLAELTDILNFQALKKRQELYTAWILTLIDKAMSNYTCHIHHTGGIIRIKLPATLLATFKTREGYAELWCWIRDSGDERPDLSVFKGGEKDPVDELVIIEVKNYKRPPVKQLRAAPAVNTSEMSDTYIFLVNYGAKREKLKPLFPGRTDVIGQIIPQSKESEQFIKVFRDKLPAPDL